MSLLSYFSDIAITALFGVGYYLFRNNKKHFAESKELLDVNVSKNQFNNITNTEELKNYIVACNNNDIQDPIELIALMMNKNIIVNNEIYEHLLVYCSRTDNQSKGFNFFFNELFSSVSFSYIENSQLISNIIKAFAIKHAKSTELSNEVNYPLFINEVYDVITKYESKGFILESNILEAILNSHYVLNYYSEGISYFYKNKSKFILSSESYVLVLKLISSIGQRNIQTLSSSSSTLKNQGLMIKVFSIVQEVTKSKLVNSDILYEIMETCIIFNDYIKAEEIKKLINSNFSQLVNEQILVTFMKLNTKKDISSVVSAFDLIKKFKNNSSLTIYSYISLIDCFSQCKNSDNAETYFYECCNLVSKSSEEYSRLVISLINCYKSTKSHIKAYDLYEQRIKCCPYLSVSTLIFNSLIDCFVDCGKYNKVYEIFDQMIKIDKDSISIQSTKPTSNLITYSLLLKSYCKTSKVEEAKNTYNFLKSHNEFKLNLSLYNTFLDCLARNKEEEYCISLFEEMKTKKIERNINTYGIIIKLYSSLNNYEKVMHYYDYLNNSTNLDFKPNIIIYQIVIKFLINLGNINDAMINFNNMIKNKINPDNIMYELMIKSCIDNKKYQNAFDLFSEATKSQIKLANYCFENLLILLLSEEIKLLKEDRENLINQLLVIVKLNTVKVSSNLSSHIKNYIQNLVNDYTLSRNDYSGNLGSSKKKIFCEKELILLSKINQTEAEIRVDYKNISYFFKSEKNDKIPNNENICSNNSNDVSTKETKHTSFYNPSIKPQQKQQINKNIPKVNKYKVNDYVTKKISLYEM